MVSERKKRSKVQETAAPPSYRLRRWIMLGLLGLSGVALSWGAVVRHVVETKFLQQEGANRYLRVLGMPAHRGMILDRRGEPLAISTPMDTVAGDPREVSSDLPALAPLAKALQLDAKALRDLLAEHSDRHFVYLKRRVPPQMAARVRKLGLPGVEIIKEYRRFYPSGEVMAHIVGITDIDDVGREGLELSYDTWLRGTPGRKRVLRDGKKRVIADVESISEPRPGKDLRISLDRRLQFLAYLELKSTVQQHKAKGGSVVILDAKTGEILAMASQPGYNPNGDREDLRKAARNRGLLDRIEPGSTMKPFAAATALELGLFSPDTQVDTSPGVMSVQGETIRDHRDYGLLDVSGVIRKSSNVGAAKIALSLPKEAYWQMLRALGFGIVTTTGFPAEATGVLRPPQQWARIDQASLAFGYGISATPVQLAQAYAVLATDGLFRPVSLLPVVEPQEGRQVMRRETARAVRKMLEGVVSTDGTAPAAAIDGYRVAGKTGTAKKTDSRGASGKRRYRALFAGMAPASEPRLVAVVVIDEPSDGMYYGGQVAAPLFAKVMAGALRLINVAPDDRPGPGLRVAGAEVSP